MNLPISKKALHTLKNLHISPQEIEECFLNRQRGFLENSDCPRALWFIAETDYGRILKIIFVKFKNGDYQIQKAFEPNKIEVKTYGQTTPAR